MSAPPAALPGRVAAPRRWLAVALVAAVSVGVVALIGRAAAPSPPAVPLPASPTVSFVIALRTFAENDVALADQAAATSASPGLRSVAAALAADGNRVAAGAWSLFGRWSVPGVDRLPDRKSVV